MSDRKTWKELLTEALTLEGSLSKVYNRFYNYSFGNQMLLYCQDVEEPVATFLRWRQLGRYVKKGSKAKMISRPIPIKKKNDKGEVEEEFTMFKYVPCVFTLSDTEGAELRKETKTQTWDADLACEKLEITKKKFSMLNGNVQGYAEHHNLAINPVAEYPLETMGHELAHIILGHTEQRVSDTKHLERSVKEFQAEAVSFILMNEAEAKDGKDWNRTECRGYIQHWLKGKEPTEEEIRPIFSAVDRILRAGRA